MGWREVLAMFIYDTDAAGNAVVSPVVIVGCVAVVIAAAALLYKQRSADRWEALDVLHVAHLGPRGAR